MGRISKLVSLLTTFAVATAISIAPANATTQPATITAPAGPSVMVANLALSYTLPETPRAGSVLVTLSRTSPASPSVSRIFVMGNSQSVSLNINPFASNGTIISQGLGNISSVDPQSDDMQVGVYTISVSYQDATSSPLATTSLAGTTLTLLCDVGSFSTDGNVPVGGGCTLAPRGSYVSLAGSTSATVCDAGYFTINDGSPSCLPAPAGKFSTAGNVGVAPSECAAGTYQPSQGQSECLLARVGHYVSDTGQITDLICPLGTYRAETGRTSCVDAPAGTYVSVTGAQAASNCLVGTFSSSTRSTSCIPAPANFYVATVAATSATACPSGYTSDAGSDAATDCIAPVVVQTPAVVVTPATNQAPAAKASPFILKGKKRTIKSIAIESKMSIPAKAKLSASVAKASKRFCVVSGSSIKAIKRGTCVVTVKVKPKKGATKSKTTRIAVK